MATKDYRDSHTYEGKGANYAESFHKQNHKRFMWEWEQKILKKIGAKYLKDKPASSYLDFACGTGRILGVMSQFASKSTGVDISASMLEVAKKELNNVEFYEADLTRDNVLGTQKFDAISAFRFFVNAQQSLREEALEALAPMLKDDGVFVFNIHKNTNSISCTLSRWNGAIRGKKLSNNFNTLSVNEMKKMLAKHNIEIVETYHRGIVPVFNDDTKIPLGLLDGIESFSAAIKVFNPFTTHIILVCKKK